MKRKVLLASVSCAVGLLVLTSCGSKKFLATYAPEESGLNITKITDESKSVICGPLTGNLSGEHIGKNKNEYKWSIINCLSTSPNGDEIAYLARMNKQDNIMVRRGNTGSSSAATQRTFRNIESFCWGPDEKLYFIDVRDNQKAICSLDAHKGSLMTQLTSNNLDFDPAISSDGKVLFFTRHEGGSNYSIWSYNLTNGELTNCARGFQPATIPGKMDEFICVRNSTEGNSEIWRINFVNGQETLLLSDKGRGYTSPCVSPDGNWLLVVGNTKSTVNKKKNLDIFALRIDGSNLMQMTYHPADDACPKWSKDGSSIYFLSTRANKDEVYNIWRMNFR